MARHSVRAGLVDTLPETPPALGRFGWRFRRPAGLVPPASAGLRARPRRGSRFDTPGPDEYRRIKSQSLAGLASLLSELQESEKYLKRFVVKERGRVFLVPIGEVDWLEASGNYVTLHRGSTEYLIRATFTELEHQLDPRQFVRVHRSALVRFAAVLHLERTDSGDFRVLLTNGQELSLSRTYRKDFEARLGRQF